MCTFPCRCAIRLFDADLERDADQFGRVLRDLIQDAWQDNGPEATLKLIAEANRAPTA